VGDAGDFVGGGVVIERPNLARRPFLDSRPVWVAGGVLAAIAVVLTGVNLWEFVSAQGAERALEAEERSLRTRYAALEAEVQAADRRLAAVSWRRLEADVRTMQEVVARRRVAWSRLLVDLERVVPWDVRLVSIVPMVDDNGAVQVTLTGVATGRDAWLRLLGRCFADSSFSEPVPGSEEAPSAGNTLGYRFQLRVRYWPEGRP
jgi:Tfp pilus assembly protein PilN